MIYLMMIESDEDKNKFEILYEKYRNLMYKVAFGVVKDEYFAEDAVHDTFVKIAKNMSKIGDVEDKKTRNFIMVVTKNTALDSYRKRTKSAEQEISVNELNDLDSYAACDSAEEDYEDSTENRVLDIIRNMSDGYKNVFLLKYVNGLSNGEIAEVLGITEATIRKRLSRGKEIIENILEGKGE